MKRCFSKWKSCKYVKGLPGMCAPVNDGHRYASNNDSDDDGCPLLAG